MGILLDLTSKSLIGVSGSWVTFNTKADTFHDAIKNVWPLVDLVDVKKTMSKSYVIYWGCAIMGVILMIISCIVLTQSIRCQIEQEYTSDNPLEDINPYVIDTQEYKDYEDRLTQEENNRVEFESKQDRERTNLTNMIWLGSVGIIIGFFAIMVCIIWMSSNSNLISIKTQAEIHALCEEGGPCTPDSKSWKEWFSEMFGTYIGTDLLGDIVREKMNDVYTYGSPYTANAANNWIMIVCIYGILSFALTKKYSSYCINMDKLLDRKVLNGLMWSFVGFFSLVCIERWQESGKYLFKKIKKKIPTI